jgi:hypothetical protein
VKKDFGLLSTFCRLVLRQPRSSIGATCLCTVKAMYSKLCDAPNEAVHPKLWVAQYFYIRQTFILFKRLANSLESMLTLALFPMNPLHRKFINLLHIYQRLCIQGY